MQTNTERQHMQNHEGVGKESVIYLRRFSSTEDHTREITWKVLCKDFLQKFIHQNATVVDLGAGDGCFIRNISAGRKIAVDLSEHARALAQEGVEVHICPATEFAEVLDTPCDVVFMSNFLEHLPSKQILFAVLEECHRALKSGGKVMILQPNIRYVGPKYWDYVDHHIALTENSLVEALEVCGFSIETMIPRFLPYSAKSKVGAVASFSTELLVKLYLRLPILWRFFGAQTFVIAKK